MCQQAWRGYPRPVSKDPKIVSSLLRAIENRNDGFSGAAFVPSLHRTGPCSGGKPPGGDGVSGQGIAIGDPESIACG